MRKKYTVRPPKYFYVSYDGGKTRQRIIADVGYNGYARRAQYEYSQMNIVQKFIYRKKMQVKNWKQNVFYPYLRNVVRPFVFKWIITPTFAAMFLYLLVSWAQMKYGQPEVFQSVQAEAPHEMQVVQVEQFYKGLPPALEKACFCESQLNHTKDGKVLTGTITPSDIGICQINRGWHEKTAKALGYNLANKEDNIQFAKVLFAKEGLQPWSASIDTKTLKCKSKELEKLWTKRQ